MKRAALGAAVLLAGCVSAARDSPPPDVLARARMPAAVQFQPDISARDILAEAHRATGGTAWREAKSLYLEGYSIIRKPDGTEVLWDKYAMWREFSDQKLNAHAAEGKVRIEAWTGGTLAMLISFDGTNTYSQNGVVPEAEAAKA